ncbi:MAG: hypothetical protein KA479_01125 [Saprospiraceae bacterium]|nr:hypothetical protein [Saprospiraceae bacterium]
MKQIVLAAPTQLEMQLIESKLKEQSNTSSNDIVFAFGGITIQPIITGPGIPMTILNLDYVLKTTKPDFLIHVGIAGGKKNNLELGQVLQVSSEFFGDIGAEDRDGRFLDMFQLGLIGKNESPWVNGKLTNPYYWSNPYIRSADGVTVNCIPGTEQHQLDMETRGTFEIESMEGAALFYVALANKVPFCSLRSISNFIEPRNREKWEVEKATENLATTCISLIETITQT